VSVGGFPVDAIEARLRVAHAGFSLDVDLRLPARGVTAVFGRSGSGKTTLLRCIAGLERAAEGRLVVAGEVWQDARRFLPAHRRPIGYVFQEASLFPHLSVLGNLRYGMVRAEEARRADLGHVIELLGIGHLLDRKPARLSGGERQRVAIARALAVGRRLLLMDEPLSALDLERKREILPYLERLHDELEIPVLYVSHSPDEVARLADHLVVLERGRALASGPLGETLSRVDLPLRLGAEEGSVIEATVAELDTPWHLARIDFDGGSLWVADVGLKLGQRVRVRVLARDVSLALDPGTSSIQNVLSGEVAEVAEGTHPGLARVRLRVGRVWLVAHLTRRALALLAAEPGKRLWVQVKSVALIE
jgi:molybdate transport system ATP-binding protein